MLPPITVARTRPAGAGGVRVRRHWQYFLLNGASLLRPGPPNCPAV
eukprot:SAG22_NODE_10807_length_515_cov_0.745192_2_plen_45_part_01